MNKKRILLTGGTGFLGRTINQLLKPDFNIVSAGRSLENEIIVDFSNEKIELRDSFDIIIHAAGLAHKIPSSKKESDSFIHINYYGTLKLLKAIELCPSLPRQFIFISTVAVYGVEKGTDIKEDHPLNGDTPYARSKMMAETAIQDWCEKNKVLSVILRLPLVVGEHPPGNLGAIYKAIRDKQYLKISGNKARKSAVLASDVAALIPRLEGKSGVFNLTDGVHPLFSEIEAALEKSTGNQIHSSLTVAVMYGFAWFGNFLKLLRLPAPLTTATLRKMLSTLTFNDEKARKELGWQPRPVTEWIAQNLK